MHRFFPAAAPVLLALLSAGCDGSAKNESATLEFRPDVALGQEAYVCFGFDAGSVRARGINGIDWEHPDGPVVLHHAKLYATPTAYPPGPIPCDQRPTGAIPLHTWLPGGGSLSLPDDVAVTLPIDAVSLVVEAHVFRTAAGAAPLDRARLALARLGAPIHAGWTARSGIVPALRPGHIETTTDLCALSTPLHVFVAWPHEHLLGRSFQAVVATGAGPVTMLDVPSWNFASEAPAVLDLDLSAGDVLSLTCAWNNTTDHYVLPGPKTTDEMCAIGMVVAPPPGAQLPCSAN